MAKTAIITGGSRGLGAAMTRRLGKMGYNIVLNYHSDSSERTSWPNSPENTVWTVSSSRPMSAVTRTVRLW